MTSGDQDVFIEQLTRNQHRIFAYIATLMPNRDDAEDVFQEACLVLWKKWQEYDPRRSFFGWACGVAHNKVRNKLRTGKGVRLQLSEDVLSQIAEVRKHADELLEARSQFLGPCLDRLSDEQRQLLERCYLGDDSIRTIAQTMCISPAALTMRLQRIRRMVFECIDLAGKNSRGESS
jgi:RNA polymerase sigma-70 factor (ECF subfamily)